MKTDPNACAVAYPEVRQWAVLHDLVAHPLLALSGYAAWAARFHDWTSARAWPRPAAARPSIEERLHDAYVEGLADGAEDGINSIRPIVGGYGVQGPQDEETLWQHSETYRSLSQGQPK